MEGPRRLRKRVHLHHARLEATGPGRDRLGVIDLDVRDRAGCACLLPVEQLLERAGLGDLEVIAGDEADVRAAPERPAKGAFDPPHAAFLDEGGHNGHVGRLVEQRDDVARERVPDAAGGQGMSLGRRPGQVVAFAWNDVPGAAPGIVHIPAVAGDDVHVEVHHCLASGCASVEANVVAVGTGRQVVEALFHVPDELHDRGALLVGCREPVSDEASSDDEGVPRRDRERISDRERERVRGDPARRGKREKWRQLPRVSH